jgi:hypothetical protein
MGRSMEDKYSIEFENFVSYSKHAVLDCTFESATLIVLHIHRLLEFYVEQMQGHGF